MPQLHLYHVAIITVSPHFCRLLHLFLLIFTVVVTGCYCSVEVRLERSGGFEASRFAIPQLDFQHIHNRNIWIPTRRIAKKHVNLVDVWSPGADS